MRRSFNSISTFGNVRRVSGICAVLLLSSVVSSFSCASNRQSTQTGETVQTSPVDTAKAPPTPGSIQSPTAPVAKADSSAATSNEDRDLAIFREKIRQATQSSFDKLAIGERNVAVGKLFLGVPYVGGTLDIDSTQEHLILNLRGLDCVTFYENTLAISRLLKKFKQPSDQNYKDELELLRYRDGKRNGFASRLHYTVDYFRNSEKKGVLKDVTRDAAGSLAKLDQRTINFMSTHRGSYKQLATNDAELARIRDMESNINKLKGYYNIPKENIAAMESKIQSGDILGITTNIEGLDCSHTGIAVRGDDGRIHFLHASSLMKKVIVTDEPLAEYLTHSSRQTGIIVMRPIEVGAH